MKVAELTGDMQLSKRDMEKTQVIVTTPEKWDVVTRKSGDGTLVSQLKVLIIDEVHLLADGRGSVIETLVARTLRFVESSQSLIRIVGLSATLPNYKDVATFLRVSKGLFHFDTSYRPVPLEQTFFGVKETNRFKSLAVMNQIAYEQALLSVTRGDQVLIFVHSRKDTAGTLKVLRELAQKADTYSDFTAGLQEHEKRKMYLPLIAKSRNKDVRENFESGMALHHAGMLRTDRTLSENMFYDGIVRVMCCTATLAWGVNLPAHTVIIKGTQVYSAEKGGLMSLSMLDVMQIFGRAGRPQFDTSGEAMMITSHDELPRYLGLLSRQMPIESTFIKALPDHLNAEVVSGTVTNLEEASSWLGYTYLYIRMLRNPMAYGITYEEKEYDPRLDKKREELLTNAIQVLVEARMIGYDSTTKNMAVTNLGRVASHYYISHDSILTFNERMKTDTFTDENVFSLLCSSSEFEQIQVRDDEMQELEKLQRKFCPIEVLGGTENGAGKVNVLLQAYISRAPLTGFTLISDTNYAAQNGARVARALFEIALKRGWPRLAESLLSIANAIDVRMWWTQHPLRQFWSSYKTPDILYRLESEGKWELTVQDIQNLGLNPKDMKTLLHVNEMIPNLDVHCIVKPITHNVIQTELTITASFTWDVRTHGTVQPFWIWIEDENESTIFHKEPFLLFYKNRTKKHQLFFTLPLFQPTPNMYIVRILSSRWTGIIQVS